MTPSQRKHLLCFFDKVTLNSTVSEVQTSATEHVEHHVSILLSISPEDSGITTLPLITLHNMWNKANELVSSDNAITKPPGNDMKARMVLSHSSSMPHMVCSGNNGKYQCDSNSLQWLSSKICLHCVAVAHE